ncbi:MAG: hypothetical protein ABIB71_09005 [Candidatus Woesearchaeota archaeon]
MGIIKCNPCKNLLESVKGEELDEEVRKSNKNSELYNALVKGLKGEKASSGKRAYASLNNPELNRFLEENFKRGVCSKEEIKQKIYDIDDRLEGYESEQLCSNEKGIIKGGYYYISVFDDNHGAINNLKGRIPSIFDPSLGMEFNVGGWSCDLSIYLGDKSHQWLMAFYKDPKLGNYIGFINLVYKSAKYTLVENLSANRFLVDKSISESKDSPVLNYAIKRHCLEIELIAADGESQRACLPLRINTSYFLDYALEKIQGV